MAEYTVTQKLYQGVIRRLFPSGWAWRISSGSYFDRFIESLSVEPARIDERAKKFLEELDPNTTFEMLDVYERLLGIPDACTPDGDITLLERRVRILQKLTTGGGQSFAFYRLIAQQLGYSVEELDFVQYTDFRVGIARVGDALTNSTDPDGEVNEQGWAYAFTVTAPAEFVRYFKVGQSTVGERLVLLENTTLECVIKRFAPAHTIVLFSYEEE